MAIDSADKRRSALGIAAWILPGANSDVDSTDRALLLRAYVPFAVSDAVTPSFRALAISVESRAVAILRELRVKVTP